ncbi:hypothetical protein V501_01479 [Pseudogymnoascus sp. VKM F-4519 (FW-2642)]|nr:hypothetical protein V501_01479 [Pseudogymnoascus sp. VKM F-4519 (FW-2642)]
MSYTTTPVPLPNPLPEPYSAVSPSDEVPTNEIRQTDRRHQDDQRIDRFEAPDALGKPAPIWRTVVRSEGPIRNRVKKGCALDEEEYYSIQDKDIGSAIELVKEVNIIPTDETELKHRQRGNKALGGAIIQEVTSEKIVVRCPLLCEAIREIIYWPSAAFSGGLRSLEFHTPYRAIGAHRQQFAQLQAALEEEAQGQIPAFDGAQEETDISSAEPDDQRDSVVLLNHLKLFLEQVDRVQKDGIRDEQQRNEKKMVTFDYLWVLFNPGKFVYVDIDGAMVACRVRLLVWGGGDILSTRSTEDSYRQVELHLWYLDHDGTTINRRRHTVVVPRFEGAKPISELPVHPRDLLSQEMRLEKQERGRRYFAFVKQGFSVCSYNGMLSTATSDPHNPENHRQFTGRVIVDPEIYFREHGRSKGVKWLDEADTQSSALGEEMKQFVKVKPSMKAAWFHVQALREYKFDRALFHTIAMPDQDLEDIEALTQRGKKTSLNREEVELAFSPDCIEHKGEGCVILLHGRPGLGKTYATECIAEYSERPLLRLTCAELGLEPTNLEKTLEKYLRWSERWRAIVLIDEADVYTSKRVMDSSISREAIVAVLLKSLEYYSGIIFLTTNRVDAFDVAVIDRIDLIVRFRPLDSSQKKKIRETCIGRLMTEEVVELDSEAKSAFAMIDEDTDSQAGWKAGAVRTSSDNRREKVN